jgi:peptide/nickel transport system substrate-binding protein
MSPSRGRTQFLRIALAVVIVGALAVVLRPRSTPGTDATGRATNATSPTSATSNASGPEEQPQSGGLLVSTVRAEPRTFNRLVTADLTSATLAALMHARLVRVNQLTQRVEPWLAERWDTTDNVHYLLHLRPDVTFSDGTPFTAADVVFTFAALYDPRANSLLADAFKIEGKPIEVVAQDEHTVALAFPAPYGPGLRLLDNLPILPRHRLEAALNAGTFRDAWGTTTAPNEIVGLGPFVLHAYVPGERVELERNPHYWRVDSHGTRLPYLDRLTLEIVPNQSAEMLRLEGAQADLVSSELRPDDVPAFRKMAEQGRAKVFDVGPGLDADFLWFNLKPDGPATRSDGTQPVRPWLARREFRQAVACAIDRQQFVNTVLLGAGTPVYGPVTPANQAWYAADLPTYPHDVEKARALLATIGLTDRDNDGMLDNADGTRARFTLFTQKGRPLRERASAFIKEDLRKIGLDVEVSALEFPALIDRVTKGSYDAVYFGIGASDTDPAVNLDFWLSKGAFHVWNPGQATPATPWEGEIDALMHKQMQTADQAERKRLFHEVQRIFATEMPLLYFAAPNVIIASSARVVNAHPVLLQPQVLWSAETLGVRP